MSESVKQILMRRDGNSEAVADKRIAIFQADFNSLLDDDNLSLLDAEELIYYHFGLEPDYLMEFL